MNKLKNFISKIKIQPYILNYIAFILIVISLQSSFISVMSFRGVWGLSPENNTEILKVLQYMAYFAIALKLYCGYELNKARPNIFLFIFFLAAGAMAIYILDIVVVVGYVKLGFGSLAYTPKILNFLIPNFSLILLVFALIYFFLFYVPRSASKLQIVLLRCMVIIPLSFIIASYVLNDFIGDGTIKVSPFIQCLLLNNSVAPSLFVVLTMIFQYIYIKAVKKSFGIEEYYAKEKSGYVQSKLNMVTSIILIWISCGCWVLVMLFHDQLIDSPVAMGRYLFLITPLIFFFQRRKTPANVIVEIIPAFSYLVGIALMVFSTVICLLYTT